jgi:DNA topoisomerase-1
MKLVIVESPAKAKTINKYLGNDYKVIASFGHIRDLPSKNGSVLPDEDFKMSYEIPSKSEKYVKEITSSAKNADAIYLATDPDREGEAISWHIVEALRERKALKKDVQIKRIAFNEITKKTVLEAVANPRELDMSLVNAQQARRALDYLVGFTLSPILWRKLPGSRSAGRVQSVALRMICEREEEIEKFISVEYWDIIASMRTILGKDFKAKLSHINGKKLDKLDIKNETEAKKIVEELLKSEYLISKLEKKQQKRNPQPPFTTSSLQQEAARKLGFTTKKTMQLAQKLYEGFDIDGETIGLITYMRTDGVSLSEDFVKETRNMILNQFGKEYLPSDARIYKAKAKNAQEAHEAIRPTNIALTPARVQSQLDKDFFKLYELIWKRTVACQMEQAIIDMVAATIDTISKKYSLRANGSTIRFDGFYKLYREDLDDSAGDDDDSGGLLPPMNEGETAEQIAITPAQHFTEPKPRFTEASLVKNLEELGIGRPSTYSAIISVIQDRNYVRLEKKRFFPEERGRIVTAFLVSFFYKYVEYDFTAKLENDLDIISEGSMDWKNFLSSFWKDFNQNIGAVGVIPITDIIASLEEMLAYHLFPKKSEDHDPRLCPKCSKGKVGLRLGKFGAFLACDAYPDCDYKSQITSDDETSGESSEDGEIKPKIAAEDKLLGTSPDGINIWLKKGPYGPYVQLGEAESKKDKPKRASLPKTCKMEDVDLSMGINLLSLPRVLGNHPETGAELTVSIGKFGPYVKYQNKFTSIPKNMDMFTIRLEDAIKLLPQSPT